MKRWLAVLVFVLALSITLVAYAGGEMVGKAVEGTFPIWVHGNKLQKDVIVIEGTSYAPVRVIGESLGLDVEFKDNQVFLGNRKKLPNYKFKSDVTRIDQPEFYVIKDGEWYCTIKAFHDEWNTDGGKVEWDGKDTTTVTMSWGNKTVFKNSEEYYPGIAGFVINGRAVVSLTALGLKPVIKVDEVWLERIE